MSKGVKRVSQNSLKITCLNDVIQCETFCFMTKHLVSIIFDNFLHA